MIDKLYIRSYLCSFKKDLSKKDIINFSVKLKHNKFHLDLKKNQVCVSPKKFLDK